MLYPNTEFDHVKLTFIKLCNWIVLLKKYNYFQEQPVQSWSSFKLHGLNVLIYKTAKLNYIFQPPAAWIWDVIV